MKTGKTENGKMWMYTAERIGKAALAPVLVLNAVCTLVWMETIWRGGNMMIFLMENTPFALYGAVFILLLSLALLFLLGRAAPALMINNLFFLLIGSVQHFKLEMRGEPFQFTDISMAREAFGAAGNMMNGGIEITPDMVWAFVLMAAVVPLLFAGVRICRGRLFRRITGFAVCISLLGGWMVFATTEQMGMLKDVNLTHQVDDYTRRGMLAAFINRMPLLGEEALEEPENYSPEAVRAVLDGHRGTDGEPAVRPNILFVMSESFYDVTMDLKLSEDPLAYFRELQEKHWGGSYITPVYGGSTVIAEYEVLTGYRAAETDNLCFTSPGGVIQEGMDSMIPLLESYGYFTQAIHPGTSNFYSRETAYEMMGFDSTLFIDDLDPLPQEEFIFPSDEYLFGQIIKAYENRPKDRPWFCHAVTYQNHGGYGFDLSADEVQVLEDGLTDTEMLNARNYANMLKISDDMLRGLVDYFERQEEPTVIVMWGDHAPAIRQFGRKLANAPLNMLDHYRMPLLVYSNYDLDTSCLPQEICSYRLGAYVLRMLGMDRDPYFNYLSSEDAHSIWVYGALVQEDGVWTENDVLHRQAADTMRMLHYDRLFGEQYGEAL